MRKLVLAAALSGTMLTLAACSGAADETTDAADTAAVEATEDAAAAETAAVLDANTATAEQLAGTEGVSEELAAAIDRRILREQGLVGHGHRGFATIHVVEHAAHLLDELETQAFGQRDGRHGDNM